MADEKEKKNTTVLGQETVFDGVIEFTDNLVITGTFKGTIKAVGDLEIDKTGICDVDEMFANSIVVSGKITGNIHAPERVELCNGCAVRGTIETGRLRIADNVDFEGKVSMIDSVPDVDLFSVVSEEYKQGLILKSDAPR
ncbi:MAG: polymer-forming cytoskeletal protein [Treponema sp.]|nr:polymer-forming cytoskeletal protein [Treponema sp.]